MMKKSIRIAIYFATTLTLASTGGMSVIAENISLDIFDLPSANHTVVAEGQGYFPVLNQAGGRLFAIFRAGGGHINIGGDLVGAWSDENGLQWFPPTPIVSSIYDDRNPAVGITPTKRIVLGYHEQASYNEEGKWDPSLKRARGMYTWSDDDGATWNQPKPFGVPGLESGSPYGRVVSGTDGVLLMNIYGPFTDKIPGMAKIRQDREDYAYLIRSQDNGATWGDPSLITEGHNETTLLPLSSRRILAAARSTGMQRVDVCMSEDGGRVWSSPLRITGQSQHPADLLRLSNGWILLAYGDRSVEAKMIHGVITRDEGRSWDINNDIILSRPVRGDFGYPSAVLTPNGKIAVMYYCAGDAKDYYDGSKALAYMNLFNEADFINAYTNLFLGGAK
ncbi:MAG: sialidase family protein [Candidatus Omnitrophota bacterium]